MAPSRSAAKGSRAVSPKRPRRIENRLLDALIGLRVSQQERAAMDWKAKQLGYRNAQDWIRHHMRPEIDMAVIEMGAQSTQEELVAAS